jgi:hypothetical protein
MQRSSRQRPWVQPPATGKHNDPARSPTSRRGMVWDYSVTTPSEVQLFHRQQQPLATNMLRHIGECCSLSLLWRQQRVITSNLTLIPGLSCREGAPVVRLSCQARVPIYPQTSGSNFNVWHGPPAFLSRRRRSTFRQLTSSLFRSVIARRMSV